MPGELMSGYLDSPRNALSRITIQSLADLGYQVDVTQGDAYMFAPAPTAPSAMAPQRGYVMSEPLKPAGFVDRFGRVTPLSR